MKTATKPKKEVNIPKVCEELQQLQRQRWINLKSRIMISNRLIAAVALHQGYSAGLEEDDREAKFEEARKIIKAIKDSEEPHFLRPLIQATQLSFDGFDTMVDGLEKEMLKLIKPLPIMPWVDNPQQRGFGALSLAVLIGETGDLNNYENPGKVWRRMGCAPYEKDGVVQMGATWKGGQNGKLAASDWSEFGYSPRRRSITFLFGENLLKGNQSVYRKRYDDAKASAMERHPEWGVCKKCVKGKVDKKKCPNCKGEYASMKMHYHRHAMLLSTKLLLKNLWIEWTGAEYRPWGS